MTGKYSFDNNFFFISVCTRWCKRKQVVMTKHITVIYLYGLDISPIKTHKILHKYKSTQFYKTKRKILQQYLIKPQDEIRNEIVKYN